MEQIRNGKKLLEQNKGHIWKTHSENYIYTQCWKTLSSSYIMNKEWDKDPHFEISPKPSWYMYT